MRTRVLLTLIMTVLVIGGLWVVTISVGSDREVSNLGDEVFEIGRIGRIAAEIADRGPILYTDLVGGDRAIFVQHLGNDPEVGWRVFPAFAPAPPAECALSWQPEDEIFAACDGRQWGAGGGALDESTEDLLQYPVEVDGGVVSVDLNFAARPADELDEQQEQSP